MSTDAEIIPIVSNPADWCCASRKGCASLVAAEGDFPVSDRHRGLDLLDRDVG